VSNSSIIFLLPIQGAANSSSTFISALAHRMGSPTIILMEEGLQFNLRKSPGKSGEDTLSKRWAQWYKDNQSTRITKTPG